MRSDEEIRLVIDIEVHDVDAFEQLARRCVEASRSEPGTLVYDWYVDAAAGKARLYEAYASADALEAHVSGPVFTDPELGPALLGTCTFVHVDAYGDLSEPAGGFFWPTTVWGPPFAPLSG